MAKTYSQKPTEIERRWLLIDASEAPVGRIATQIATFLTGKYKQPILRTLTLVTTL